MNALNALWLRDVFTVECLRQLGERKLAHGPESMNFVLVDVLACGIEAVLKEINLNEIGRFEPEK